MKKGVKTLSWALLVCMLALIMALPATALAAQDKVWVEYNLPRHPYDVVTIGNLVYAGTDGGLYKGTGDDWVKVDTGGFSLGTMLALAYDPKSQIMYVSDSYKNKVLVWNMVDNTWNRYTHRDFTSFGLDVYRDGDQFRLYVSDREGDFVYESRGAEGNKILSTDTDPVGEMNEPFDVVRHGNMLYVADRYNDRILVCNASYEWSEIVHPDYTYDVTNLAVLSEGTLYYSEYSNNRVIKFKDGRFTEIMGDSESWFGPWGVYADEWDNLFICDSLRSRILRSKDDNDRLAEITVDGEPLSGFSPDTDEHAISCDYDTESIDLYAKAQSPYAVVTGTGTKELEVGENTFTIRVDPEQGTHRDYVLHVTRLAPPNPAYTAELTSDADTVEVGEDVTFTLTLVNTGDVGFTDMDAVNTVSTEHPIVDLMLGVGETRTEEITVTAGDEDVEEGVRLAYDVVGRTAMGHEIHVSTGTCAVAVNGPDTGESEEAAAAATKPADATASPVVSASPNAAGAVAAEDDAPGEPGGVSNTLLWAGGGLLLLLLMAVIILLIILLRQKKKQPPELTVAAAPAPPDTAAPKPPADAADSEEPVDAQIEETKDTPED